MPWLSSVLFLTLAVNAVAASKIDLDRVTAVPADQPIPTQDFFRPPMLAQPILNPAGTHIAAVITANEEKHFLMVYDIGTESIETVRDAGTKDIYNVSWLNDKRLLFHLAAQKKYGLGMMVANVGDLHSTHAVQQYSGSSLISIPLKSPLNPLVWNRFDFETGRDTGVVALNTNIKTVMIDLSGASISQEDIIRARENNDKCILRVYPMAQTKGVSYGYMADKVGELAYSFASEKGDLSMLRLEGKAWVKCPVDLEIIDIIGNANDPGYLLVAGPAKEGKPQPLQLMEAATGKLGDTILQDQQYDFNGRLYRNRTTGDVLGAVFNKSVSRVYWFNEQYQSLQKALDGMFPNQIVHIYGNDDQHRIFLVATYSDKSPVAYHWVNLETRKAGLFKNSAPWIDPKRMQPMQIMPFKTRDGHKLDTYLTLPAGASKTSPAPLVVLCHGGPWARDTWAYNGEVQFLAHHGYAVLQTNYRGSTGSAGRFPEGDEYDFIKMHNDVTDAVKTALKSGLVDKDRVGIMGGSFGGYLAVSGVAHEPDLYRCAVSNAGVFDWALQVQSEKYNQYDLPYYSFMIKKLGDPRVETAKYEAMSPLKHVKNIRVPVFVAGGKDDSVVELQQSKKLVAALDNNNIPYEKLFVGGEGHGMAFLKNEVELYDRILAFLDKNLMPKK